MSEICLELCAISDIKCLLHLENRDVFSNILITKAEIH